MHLYYLLFWIILVIIILWICWYLWFEAYPPRMLGWVYPEKDSSGSGKSSTFQVVREYNRHPLGQLKGIFAVSLYGKWDSRRFQEKYYGKLLTNIKFLRSLEWGKDWRYRVYLSHTLEQTALQSLLDLDCEVFIMDKDSLSSDGSVNRTGSMWRFLACQDNLPFIILDADEYDLLDRVNLKEVDKWLKSDKQFYQNALYCINLFIPVSCCCWGGKANCLPQIKELMKNLDHSWYGADEAFLAGVLMPYFTKGGLYRVSNPTEWMVWLLILLVILVIFIWAVYWYYQKNK